MEYTDVIRLLADRTRVRVLRLLSSGPLCVCHFQDLLGEGQVRVSKQLAALRGAGLVEDERCGTWRIYSLSKKVPPLVPAVLQALESDSQAAADFAADQARRAELLAALGSSRLCCPDEVTERLLDGPLAADGRRTGGAE